LIFSGPCNPYYQTAIFLNNGKELELVFESTGKLVSLVDSSRYTRLDILKSSCCCDYFSDLIRLSFNSSNIVSRHTLSFHYNTKIDAVQNLGEKVVSGKLRTTPMVNDSTQNDPCSSDIIRGNQLYEIKDKKLPIIASKNGWHLVIHTKDKNNSIIAWVKD